MISVKHIATDLIGLLFPELCHACGTNLYRGEEEICIKCLYDLPYTDFHLHVENLVAKQFWGRIPCNAMAMLYFKKGTKVQNLIHSLKYNGRTGVGIKLGKLLAERLILGDQYQNIDLVIPVPLHPKKEKLRGYNQSEYIAKGLAEILQLSVSTDHLTRSKMTETQTKKSRYTRYENMQSVFNINNKEQIENLNVLLVDDVITTGATLEACGNSLLAAGIKKLNIASIAFAE